MFGLELSSLVVSCAVLRPVFCSWLRIRTNRLLLATVPLLGYGKDSPENAPLLPERNAKEYKG